MRILFYLPVITPPWFEDVIVPMLRSLASEGEIHVLAPAMWRNTGIGPAQLQTCVGLQGIHWHIVEDESHPSLRTVPSDPDGLVEFVRSIDPAYVFCRSADVATPRRFPGKLRHLMEPGCLPLSRKAGWLYLEPEFWCHGDMPTLGQAEADLVEKHFAQPWARMRHLADTHPAFSTPRKQALESMGLPDDRKILALPLEYEHEEAFTSFHNRFERNLDLIEHLARDLENDFLLAVAEHPLNGLYVDNSAVYRRIERLGTRVRLVPNATGNYHQTDLLIKYCDGLIVQNTKAIYSGAFFGKPILRLSDRPTAAWLGAHEDLGTFKAAVLTAQSGPGEARTRLWFGCHLLHDVLDPQQTSGAELLDRFERPFASERLGRGLGRFEAHHRQLGLVQ